MLRTLNVNTNNILHREYSTELPFNPYNKPYIDNECFIIQSNGIGSYITCKRKSSDVDQHNKIINV